MRKFVFMNPFVLHHDNNPDLFCDREELLATLESHLSNGRNLMLYGPRRMGKTALLKRMLLGKKGVVVDLLACQDLGEAISKIANTLLNHPDVENDLKDPFWQRLLQAFQISFKMNTVTGEPGVTVGFSDATRASEALGDLGAYLARIQPGFILCLDEFQQITHFPEPNTEAIFRTWMQTHPNIRFAFSGSQSTLMSAMFSEKNRPFYASCSHFLIGAIPENKYVEFMRRHFTACHKTIPLDGTMSQMYRWAAGTTHWVQDQANRLFDHPHPERPEVLRQIQEAILDEAAPYFRIITHQLNSGAIAFLRSLATNPEGVAHPMSQLHIRTHNLPAASTLSSIIKSLEKKELIRQDIETGRWMLADPLMGYWLA